MKNIFLMLILALSVIKITAQTVSAHQSVASIKVVYKASPQTTVNTLPEIKSIPQAIITLKSTTGISKIYFKILNKTTNEVLYQVNYNLNSSMIINNEGKKIFENNNGVIFISSETELALKPYLYQVQTENEQNNLSNNYSSIQ